MKTIKRFEVRARRVSLVAEPVEPYGQAITSNKDVERITRKLLADEVQEVFLVLFLNMKNRVVGYTECHRGGDSVCPVDPKTVFRSALLQGVGRLVVAHNHPSGDFQPSPEDDALTKRLVVGGALLGVEVLDHIVVGDDGAYSYQDWGRMPGSDDLKAVMRGLE